MEYTVVFHVPFYIIYIEIEIWIELLQDKDDDSLSFRFISLPPISYRIMDPTILIRIFPPCLLSLRTLQLPFFYLLFFIFIQPQDIFAFNLLVHTNCKSYGSNISFHLLIFRLMYIYTYFFLVKCTYVLCLFINSINWIFMHLISLKVMAELGFGRLARKIRQISYQISIHSYN